MALELIQVVKKLPLEQLSNYFLNLALPKLRIAEPGEAEKKPITATVSYTEWDSWDIRFGNLTLQQLVNYFRKKYGLEVTSVVHGVKVIYLSFNPAHAPKLKEKMSRLLGARRSDVYAELNINYNDNGTDVTGPLVRFFYHK